MIGTTTNYLVVLFYLLYCLFDHANINCFSFCRVWGPMIGCRGRGHGGWRLPSPRRRHQSVFVKTFARPNSQMIGMRQEDDGFGCVPTIVGTRKNPSPLMIVPRYVSSYACKFK